ncbi:ferritin-like domain-containing protein [Bacillus sp. V3B]|uniref:ferritin-like domain-containing protein n=1 Tax=Bacillus sp. V3B TaxID=2804915 RepID=UPI002109620C|nr:ferritin-like domain-containing protein [Bacillus sp. V3B]MCQ6276233.1 ferritin-like domain-containing protein [Bacillus sp. V3B]
MKNTVIKELNHFLEGNFMAIHAYEKYIHHIDDLDLKQTLQKIQQDHKQHATMIAERIQNLGGIPVDDVGIQGTIAEFVKNFTESTNGTTHILKDALVGEKRGIEISQELVKGDLDSESLELVKKILNHDEKHVNLLDKLIH